MTVLYALKSSPWLNTVPVVVLNADDEDVKTTYETGGNAYVGTPQTTEGYVDLISQMGGSGLNEHSIQQSPYILIRSRIVMTDSHIREVPLAPDSLRDSVSLLSKKWHPTIVRCLSSDDGQEFSDLERRLDELEPAGEEIEDLDSETLGRIPIEGSQ